MGKIKAIIIAITSASLLGGCGMIDQQPSDDSRWVAAAKIAEAKYTALQAKYEAQNERYQQIGDIPTATLTTVDSAGEPVTVKINIAPLILAIKDDGGNYQMEPDLMPKGVFAEAIDSVGGLFGKVINSPVTAVFAAGWMAGELADKAGDHSYIQNGDIVGSNNTTKVIGDGTATGPAISGDTVMGPDPLPVD